MTTLSINAASSFPIYSAVPLNSFDSLTKYHGFCGEFLHFFGQTVKAWDVETNQYLYYSKNNLVRAIVGDHADLSITKINKISEKILEIVNPFVNKTLFTDDLKKCYDLIGYQTGTCEEGLNKLEDIKKQSPHFNQFFYAKNLSEIEGELQVGDIILRKYHEDNPNPICTLQKLFLKPIYRESYKCSHVALYLGKKQDKHWVAEASLPKGNEPQIRRLQLDEERFDLKEKNQYIIIRNNDSQVAQESARIANLYTLKMLPKNESPSTEQDRENSIKYNHFNALESMWHSKSFGLFAKHRIFKYYADYSNQVPFQYITGNRKMFCSEFVCLSVQMAEAQKSDIFQEILKENPPPKSTENQKTGIASFFARISYVVRRALWSRFMAIKYAGKMDEAFKTKIDFLRSSPQDVANYLMVDNNNYKVVGFINKSKFAAG